MARHFPQAPPLRRSDNFAGIAHLLIDGAHATHLGAEVGNRRCVTSLREPSTIYRCILVYEMFKRDFDMFKYSFEDPANKMPIGEIDLDEIHAKLSGA